MSGDESLPKIDWEEVRKGDRVRWIASEDTTEGYLLMEFIAEHDRHHWSRQGQHYLIEGVERPPVTIPGDLLAELRTKHEGHFHFGGRCDGTGPSMVCHFLAAVEEG